MRKIIFLTFFFTLGNAFGQVTVNPSAFEVDQQITITVNINNSNSCNGLNNPSKVYMHAGIGPDNNPFGYSVVGNWGQDDGVGLMTDNANGTYSITLTPKTYFGLDDTQANNATKMGMVFRNANGSQEYKAQGSPCQDFVILVGLVNITITQPATTPAVIASGANLNVAATISSGGSTTVQGTFEIFYNDVSVATGTCGFPTCFKTLTNITESGTVRFVGTPPGSTETGEASFQVIVKPTVVQETLPAGLVDGINYTSSTSATLVLDAPGKDFIEIAGSFNNYTPTGSYVMKQDPSTGKFWLPINGLTPGQNYTYQYWVYDSNPVANSPTLVKTADPFSTLVLSPFDDPFIPSTTYPNLPTYPSGQEREVTVLQTNQTPYNWQVTNFNKPKKEDLIIYEVLIRDFDADRNFQDLIDRIDYFKNLNINAIELMPVMEFEGNESWGYNTSFHMALDKFYGTEDKFKEFIDVCHQNGIAVILDIALNHAFGRNPMVRMWMNDPNKDGWGGPSSENPYFNQTARHSYSVGEDFNHQSTLTKNYTKRIVKHWIEEFKIDGFRWDLTKGFTQNCTSGDEGCTNSYQADRVAVLIEYADYSWSLDPDHYVIFEHLGGDTEEQEWANYRIGEGKGIMMWSEMWNDYKNLVQGNPSNFNRMGHTAHGFTGKRTLGYPESHDKDRMMYEMVQFGNGGSGWDLNTSLMRMSALGAVTIPIPGPKMIWHFADLGMDDSIWTCNNGVVNSDYDGNNDGDCKLDTKPQPQWVENWLGDANRSQVRSDWARLIDLKINEPVFEGNYSINSGSLTPRIYIWNDALPNLKNVVILANFGSSAQNVTPDFPYTGTWYDLMDATGSTTLNVTSTTTPINIPAGGFKVYGNMASTLSTDSFTLISFRIYPNPASKSFKVNKEVDAVSVYDITGKSISKFTGGFAEGHVFDVSKLAQGFYIIKLEQGTSAITKQLIIN
ncbi:putative secreted protein (Por secretion system target) [Flavobacteriaceae bacterium MAR_2010_105]|nr:putative secreted protein (Por secretion system target) [Flavobacteriaceae bacterium MAR_2010_105]